MEALFRSFCCRFLEFSTSYQDPRKTIETAFGKNPKYRFSFAYCTYEINFDGAQVGFGVLRWIPNRTFEYRFARRPSKNVLWEELWRKYGNERKAQATFNDLSWLRTTFGAILFAYNTCSPCLEQMENHM